MFGSINGIHAEIRPDSASVRSEIFVRDVIATEKGSLILIVECSSMKILDALWEDYYTGHLSEVAQRFLVTEDLRMFGLKEVKFTATIEEKDYRACRQYFCSAKVNMMKICFFFV